MLFSIPKVNYESFQLLQYDGGQFYRSHHDSSVTDDTPAGHRILTFFLYLTGKSAFVLFYEVISCVQYDVLI